MCAELFFPLEALGPDFQITLEIAYYFHLSFTAVTVQFAPLVSVRVGVEKEIASYLCVIFVPMS